MQPSEPTHCDANKIPANVSPTLFRSIVKIAFAVAPPTFVLLYGVVTYGPPTPWTIVVYLILVSSLGWFTTKPDPHRLKVALHGFSIVVYLFIPVAGSFVGAADVVIDFRRNEERIVAVPCLLEFQRETELPEFAYTRQNHSPQWELVANVSFFPGWIKSSLRDGGNRRIIALIIFIRNAPESLKFCGRAEEIERVCRVIAERDNTARYHQALLLSVAVDAGELPGFDRTRWYAENQDLFQMEEFVENRCRYVRAEDSLRAAVGTFTKSYGTNYLEREILPYALECRSLERAIEAK